MPVKRRRSKTRQTPRQEAAFWANFWDGGSFLLGDWPLELGLPMGGPATRAECERSPEVRALARDAWDRLGRWYLAEGIGRVEGVPGAGGGAWALREFGEPPEG